MATRKQKRTAPAETKTADGKSQQAIVENESLRRLYAVVLKGRVAGWKGIAANGSTAQAAATIELTGDDAVAGDSADPALRLLLATRNSGGTEQPRAQIIPHEGAGTSQLSIAAGVAVSQKMSGKQAVVIALAEAGTMSFGASFEALNYAAKHKLPLVVVVDLTTAADGARAPELTRLAQAHGVPAFVVDGEDAVAVYRVAREAVNRARSGRGPSLIECRKFVNEEDPLRHLERYLEKHKLWTPQWKRELMRNAKHA